MTVQLNFQPTLFVFLGTSSGQIYWRLKKLLKDAYGEVPILRFLWLDIDTKIDTQAMPFINDNERVELSGFDPAMLLRNLDKYKTIKAWWPEDMNIEPGMLAGGGSPKQRRLVGRMALFRKFNNREKGPSLLNKLESATSALKSIDNRRRTIEKSDSNIQYNVLDGTRVILVFSPCGGTGSSMAFDIAYLCRHLLRDRKPTTIVSMSVMPRVVELMMKRGSKRQLEMIQANAYAWFKEDNFLAENPYWYLEYPGDLELTIDSPPFDIRYLIDIATQTGDQLSSADDIFNMISKAIFLDTGSPLVGDVRGFAQNMDVFEHAIDGKKQIYSSLAAASLLYPKERLLDYCAEKLAEKFISQGFLSKPNDIQVLANTAGLLNQLRLRDDVLVADLVEKSRIKMKLEPVIKKADSVDDAIKNINAQEAENKQALFTEVKGIEGIYQSKLAQIQKEFDREITRIASGKGVNFATAVLNTLLEESQAGLVDRNSNSLEGLKTRVVQQGIKDSDIVIAQKELEQDKNALKRLDDGPEDILERKFFPRGWNQKFSLYKSECIEDMRDINNKTIQITGQEYAIRMYEQITYQANELRTSLSKIKNSTEQIIKVLTIRAKELGEEHDNYSSTYEFHKEIEVDFPHYYENHSSDIDALLNFSGMIDRDQENIGALENWVKVELLDSAREYSKLFFINPLESTSLLKQLDQIAKERELDSQKFIEDNLNNLLTYCHPFWQWEQERGLDSEDLEEHSLIGIEDANSKLIPDSYKDTSVYTLTTTLMRDRIDILRLISGMPAFLLYDMEEYKKKYEKFLGKDKFPLHILPGMQSAPDIIPEKDQGNREIFAAGLVFKYIVHVGLSFYYDPEREYADQGIPPKDEHKLVEDRSKSEDLFSRKNDWARHIKIKIDNDIKIMGNPAAIKEINKTIKSYRNIVGKLMPEDPMRKQLEKEINALSNFQRSLGKVS
jgi:hypothetical protein